VEYYLDDVKFSFSNQKIRMEKGGVKYLTGRVLKIFQVIKKGEFTK